MKKAGRPSKYTPETVDKILKALAVGAPYTHACNYAGIGFDAFNEWRAKYPEFSESIKEAEGRAVTGWLAKIEKAASDGNWQAAAWKLERRYPQEFGRQDKVTIDVHAIDAEIEQRLALMASRSETAIAGEAEGESVH